MKGETYGSRARQLLLKSSGATVYHYLMIKAAALLLLQTKQLSLSLSPPLESLHGAQEKSGGSFTKSSENEN